MPIENVLENVNAIIFDMDGVLVDTEPLHMKAFDIYLKEKGIEEPPPFLQTLIGHSIEDNFIMLYKKYPVLRNDSMAEMLAYRNDLYLNLIRSEKVLPIAGITEILDFCASHNFKIALASSSDTIQVNTILEKLDHTIACNFNFRKVFNTIIAGDTVAKKKPAPDIYISALNRLAVSGETTIAIEDSQAGVSSAKAAGVFCLALENPYNDVHRMQGADYIIKSIYHLLHLLKNNGQSI